MQQRRLAQFLMHLKIKLKMVGRRVMHKVLVSLGPWKRTVWEWNHPLSMANESYKCKECSHGLWRKIHRALGQEQGPGRRALVERKLHMSPNFTWGQNMVANPGAAAVLRVRRYTHPWGNLLLKEVAVRTQKSKTKEIFLNHTLRKCHKYVI